MSDRDGCVAIVVAVFLLGLAYLFAVFQAWLASVIAPQYGVWVAGGVLFMLGLVQGIAKGLSK